MRLAVDFVLDPGVGLGLGDCHFGFTWYRVDLVDPADPKVLSVVAHLLSTHSDSLATPRPARRFERDLCGAKVTALSFPLVRLSLPLQTVCASAATTSFFRVAELAMSFGLSECRA